MPATLSPPETGVPPAIKTPMQSFLAGTHDRWLDEARRVLDPARDPSAGTWLRWRAIEYLETGFRRRFERERRAVESLRERLTAAQARHLWAAGELLTQVLEGLGTSHQAVPALGTVLGRLRHGARGPRVLVPAGRGFAGAGALGRCSGRVPGALRADHLR